MSRLHVHLHVRDLEQSIRFYSILFGTPPTRQEPGYAKWMLEDPRVNFAISVGGGEAGISHLGIQVDSDEELAAVSARARHAAGPVLVERGAHCCYATGNKTWAEDPQGVRWETFHTTGALSEAGQGAEETIIIGDEGKHASEGGACGGARGKRAASDGAGCCA
ncbi:MAG: ArsI/CadI family heavy metal resistance metalloenzyme [Alphaproteobacteria bacterium]